MAKKLTPQEAAALGLDQPQIPTGGRKLTETEVKALALDQPEERPAWLTPGYRPPADPKDKPYAQANVDDALKEVREAKAKRDPGSQSGAFVRGAAQGATAGFVDEAAGIVGALGSFGESLFPTVDEQREGKGALGRAKDAYKRDRDDYRANDAAAREKYRKTFLAGELAGGLATAPVAGAGGGVVKTIARGAATGAVYGAGSSEADLTEGDVKGFAKDVALGAGVGTLGSAVGEGLKAGVRVVGRKVAEKTLRRRILNEIVEGTEATGKATPTAQKRLVKSAKKVVDEIVHGEDGDVALKAFENKSALAGVEALKRPIEKVGARLGKEYDKFVARGKGDVDLADLAIRLEDAAKQTAHEGDLHLMEAIRAYAVQVVKLAEETEGKIGLRQLRKVTSGVQEKAVSTIGGLNDHSAAELKRALSAVASEVMDDSLEKAAAGNDVLKRAVKSIRANNARYHALKTVQDTIGQRAWKEETAAPWLTRTTKEIATSAGGGAVIGAAGGAIGVDDNRISGGVGGALTGAALGAGARKGIPAAGKAIDRWLTKKGVEAARRAGLPVPPTTTVPPTSPPSLNVSERLRDAPALSPRYLGTPSTPEGRLSQALARTAAAELARKRSKAPAAPADEKDPNDPWAGVDDTDRDPWAGVE